MLTRTNLKTILTISVLQLYICSAGLADEIRDTIKLLDNRPQICYNITSLKVAGLFGES